MAFPTRYTSPGTLIDEVLSPTGVNIPSQQLVAVYVGTGSRTSRSVNEEVVRAGVLLESLSFSNASGTGDSFAFSSPTVTLTDAGAAFTSAMIGSYITISGATSAANNGTFVVTAVPTATTIQWTNASGVAEAFTGAWAVSHTATLAVRGTRRFDHTQLFRILNGISEEMPDALVFYNPAVITGTAAGTFNLGTNYAMGLELDQVDAVTLAFHDEPAALTLDLVFALSGTTMTLTRPSGSFLTDGVRAGATITIATAEDAGNDGTFTVTGVTATMVTYENAGGANNADDDTASVTFTGTGFVDREVHVLYNFTNAAAATRAEVAAAINQGMAASGALGYGAAYASIASDVTTGIRIRSPLTTAASDARVSPAVALNASTTLFGSASLDAPTVLRVADSIWQSAATWQLNYVAVSDDTDAVIQDDVTDIIRVGSQQGVSNFVEGTDWRTTSEEIDWSLDTAAILTGSISDASASDYDVSTDDSFELSIDDGSVITLDLNGLVPAPIGYANPASAANASAAEVVANINAIMGAAYGPRYGAVASVAVISGANYVRITSVDQGRAASVRLSASSASQQLAIAEVFGVASASLPYEVNGVGQRPASGVVYYASYDYTKPDTAYNRPILALDYDDAAAQVGYPLFETPSFNPLAIAAQIAFEQGAPVIYTCQIDDATTPGVPTSVEIQRALDGVRRTSGATEVVVVGEPGTRLNTFSSLMALTEQRNAVDVGQYCRAYAGMAVDTQPGDVDTADTYIYTAARTFQTAPDSPARGRFFLAVPPEARGISKDIELGDGQGTVTLTLNSTYLAAAAAARRTALLTAGSTLMNRTFNGFRLDLIEDEWDPLDERDLMAGRGCLVFSFEGGQLIILDAITTEGGGAREDKFLQDSSSVQKDNVRRKLKQAINSSLRGIVPRDLGNFLVDLRIIIGSVISGEIADGNLGPYLEEDGETARQIDLKRDIKVRRNPNSRRRFDFKYSANLLYPAAYFFGEESIDLSSLSGGASF